MIYGKYGTRIQCMSSKGELLYIVPDYNKFIWFELAKLKELFLESCFEVSRDTGQRLRRFAGVSLA